MVGNEHLKGTATLPLYITSESAVSRTNFSAFSLPYIYEIHIFGFPCCSARGDLFIDVSITNVGLILTSARQHKSKLNFERFWKKKNQIFGFPCCSTREEFSIDVSITNVGLTLTMLRWFQLFSTNQNSNFELFWIKIQIFRFLWWGACVKILVKTFPLMSQLLM